MPMNAPPLPRGNLFEEILRDPLLLEVVLVGAGVLLASLLWLWFRRVVKDLKRRAAVDRYVQGIDLFLRGRWEEAARRLEEVLEKDPSHLDARVALGDCLREMGRPAEAERLHTEALEVFGDDRLQTRISLARDLLAQKRPDRAALYLEEVLALSPRRREALELMARAQEELHHFTEAARHLRELLLVMDRPEEEGKREELRRRIGRLYFRSGKALEEAGRLGEALPAFREAVSWDPGLVQARAGVIRCLSLLGHGPGALEALDQTLSELESLAEQPDFLLLPADLPGGGRPGSPGEARPALPGGEDLVSLPPGRGEEHFLQVPEERARIAFRLLEKEAPYVCRACGRPWASPEPACPACGEPGGLVAAHPSLLEEIPRVDHLLDEIEENRAYLERKVEALYGGDPKAADQLLEVGEKVLPILYKELSLRPDPGPLLDLLLKMGPGVLPPFLEIHREERARHSKGILHLGKEKGRVLSLVARSFGPLPGAEPFFRELAESPEPEERKAALDYFLASARPEAFEALQSFARVEILNHFRHKDSEELLPLLLALKPGDFLLDWIFTDPALPAEEALVEAFLRSKDRRALAWVLQARGFHPGVEKALQAMLCHETARPAALEVMARFGLEALPHRIPVLLDPETPPEVREALVDLLRPWGERAVQEIILRCPGPRPSPVDETALELVACFGESGLPALERIYRDESGILGKFPLLRKRAMRRRELVLRALDRIAGGKAREILERLVETEGDPGLRSLGRKFLEGGGEA